MDMILVRHAAAEAGGPGMGDRDRPLAEKGIRDFSRLMPALKEKTGKYKRMEVWSSPAARARETAALLRDSLGLPQIKEFEWIYTGQKDSLKEQLKKAGACGAVFIVGHEPYLSRWGSSLLGQDLPFRKGSMACLEVGENLAPPSYLRWQITPLDEPGVPVPGESSDTADFTAGILAALEDVSAWYRRFISQPGEPRNAHQLRVALRKARSLLLFLKPVMKVHDFDKARKAFRRMALRLSSLREMDVFLEDLEALAASSGQLGREDTFPALKAAAAALRQKEQQKVHAALDHAGPSRAVGKAADPVKQLDPAAFFSKPGRQTLAERLEGWHASIRKSLDRLDPDDTKQLHRLRLRLKKFNCVNDFAESCGLIPPLPLKGSKALQRGLGHLCDVAMHRHLLKRLVAESAEPLEEETERFLFLLGRLREELLETLEKDLAESR